MGAYARHKLSVKWGAIQSGKGTDPNTLAKCQYGVFYTGVWNSADGTSASLFLSADI